MLQRNMYVYRSFLILKTKPNESGERQNQESNVVYHKIFAFYFFVKNIFDIVLLKIAM